MASSFTFTSVKKILSGIWKNTFGFSLDTYLKSIYVLCTVEATKKGK